MKLIFYDAEDLYQQGVKMCAGAFLYYAAGLLMGKRLFVRAFGNQRVKHVRDGHQPAFQRNRVARQPFRVAAAVPLFVVMARYPSTHLVEMGWIGITSGSRRRARVLGGQG